MPPRTVQSTPQQGKKTKQKVKRHQVEVGNLVMFASPHQYSVGCFGEIVHVLNHKHVVARCLAPNDLDYKNQLVVLATRKPNGTTVNGSDKSDYTNYITRVVFRAGPKAPKASKKIIPPKVIETQQELLDHLRSDSKQKVVLQLGEEVAS